MIPMKIYFFCFSSAWKCTHQSYWFVLFRSIAVNCQWHKSGSIDWTSLLNSHHTCKISPLLSWEVTFKVAVLLGMRDVWSLKYKTIHSPPNFITQVLHEFIISISLFSSRLSHWTFNHCMNYSMIHILTPFVLDNAKLVCLCLLMFLSLNVSEEELRTCWKDPSRAAGLSGCQSGDSDAST